MDETSIAADQLQAIVDRIERVEEDIAAYNADKSEIYKEAKSNGFDVAALRKIIAERRQPAHKRAEMDAILELYRDALKSRLVHAREAA